MDKITLKVKERTETGNQLNSLRKKGLIPAVIYGHKVAAKNLWVDTMEFSKVFKKAGESAIVELAMEGKSRVNVLIHDLQLEPVSNNFSHIDFFQVRMDEKVETEIPVEFLGEALAVKELGGTLVTNLDAVPVSCLPADLPQNFQLDLAKLKTFDDTITVRDITVSDKVEITVNPETVIAFVAEPRNEEELAKLDEKVEVDVSKVEKLEKEKSAETAETPAEK